jgi:hypothetical protein
LFSFFSFFSNVSKVFTTFQGNKMGQLLAMPITAKSSTDGKTNRLSYGISSMQGWRAGIIVITIIK